MAQALRRLEQEEPVFTFQMANRLMTEILAPWVRDLGLLLESIEVAPPAGAPQNWEPGATIRLPYTQQICRDGGVICPQALTALADAAMALAVSAAWNGYRPMTTMDQTVHFVRPVNHDVIADARIVRVGRNTSFGRVTIHHAADKRLVGMASSAYAMV